jgi:hypothetical protein
MMCVQVLLLDLPEDRRRVIDLTDIVVRKAAPPTPYCGGKGKLRSWKNANCCAGIFRCGEPSCAGIKVVGCQFVANPGRTRLHIVQAVIAHAEDPSPNRQKQELCQELVGIACG